MHLGVQTPFTTFFGRRAPRALVPFVFWLTPWSVVLANTENDYVLAVQHSDQAQAMRRLQDGFGLASSEPVLFAYGLTVTDVLHRVAPHLAACRPAPLGATGKGPVVHEYYGLRCGKWQVASAWLHIHHFRNQLTLLRARLPSFRVPESLPQERDFLPLDFLGFDVAPQAVVARVVAESSGFLAGAWELRDREPTSGAPRYRLIDAQTGAILAEETKSFDLATVYAEGPQDGALVTVELPDLPGTGWLDGKHVLVYAPTAAEPRVQAPDNRFEFRPDDFGEALNFDQVQAYYTATRAIAWFKQKFGYEFEGPPMVVRINQDFGDHYDGARYLPLPDAPTIEVGTGRAYQNLARDTDVIDHELAHHVIWRALQSTRGESGALHEGTADYFAYAMNDDPNLAESISPDRPWLRTAALGPDDLYDELPDDAPIHRQGEIWSAVLWELRQTYGHEFDQVVYESLAYLGPQSGFDDAFLAVLAADRDLKASKLTPDEVWDGRFGDKYCAILEVGVRRGFAQSLVDLDGATCGLDLAKLAAESRDRESPDRGKRAPHVHAFGRTCAVVSPGAPKALWILLLLLPLAWTSTPTFPTRHRRPKRLGASRDGS